jgi:hypothetical protein
MSRVTVNVCVPYAPNKSWVEQSKLSRVHKGSRNKEFIMPSLSLSLRLGGVLALALLLTACASVSGSGEYNRAYDFSAIQRTAPTTGEKILTTTWITGATLEAAASALVMA